jgi:ribose transport system permease protein
MNSSRSGRLGGLVLRNTTAILFVAVFAFFTLQTPRFVEPESISNIIKQAAFTGVIAVGMTFVLLTAGIDLSVGSNMYLSPIVAGLLMRDVGFGVFPAFIAALLVGALFGAVNAFCIVKLKIIPFLVTLATLVAGRGLGLAITRTFAVDYPQSMLDFGTWSFLGIPMPIIVFAALVLIAHLVLTQTQFGRQVFAIGNDLEAAQKAGINPGRVIAAVYVICGVCAALGGFILMAQIGKLNQGFGEGKELDVIAATVLGGTSLFGGAGNAFGAVVGSVLIQMVQAGLVFTQVNLYLQPMIQATIIFLAVFFDSIRGARLASLRRRYIRAATETERF